MGVYLASRICKLMILLCSSPKLSCFWWKSKEQQIKTFSRILLTACWLPGYISRMYYVSVPYNWGFFLQSCGSYGANSSKQFNLCKATALFLGVTWKVQDSLSLSIPTPISCTSREEAITDGIFSPPYRSKAKCHLSGSTQPPSSGAAQTSASELITDVSSEPDVQSWRKRWVIFSDWAFFLYVPKWSKNS